MSDTTRIQTPRQVPSGATRCGESRGWQWGTLTLSQESLLVWSERMLEALERGNDKRKWHTLADKVWSPKTLEAALQAVVSNRGAPGIDGQTTKAVAARAAQEVAEVSRLLRERHYEPKAVKRVWVEKAGSREKRPLGLPTVRDRIVQKALHIVLEPIFERDFAEQSYGFRPGRNAKQAVEQVESLLAEGRHWVVDADIKGYFDNIPHDLLMERVGEKIAEVSSKGADRNVPQSRSHGKRQGLAANPRRNTAGSGGESFTGQHLPRPARPRNGGGRQADDPVCRRLRDPVREPGGSGSRPGSREALDGKGGADPASRENPD